MPTLPPLVAGGDIRSAVPRMRLTTWYSAGQRLLALLSLPRSCRSCQLGGRAWARWSILDRVWFSPPSVPISETHVWWVRNEFACMFDHAVITVCIPKSWSSPRYASQASWTTGLEATPMKLDMPTFHCKKEQWTASLGSIRRQLPPSDNADPFDKLKFACSVAADVAEVYGMRPTPRRPPGRVAFAFAGQRALLREINAITTARRIVYLAARGDVSLIRDPGRRVRWATQVAGLNTLLRRSTHGRLPALRDDLELYTTPAQSGYLACWLDSAKQAIDARRQTIKDAISKATSRNLQQLRARALAKPHQVESMMVQTALGQVRSNHRMWGLTARLPTGLSFTGPPEQAATVLSHMSHIMASRALNQLSCTAAGPLVQLQVWIPSPRFVGDFLTAWSTDSTRPPCSLQITSHPEPVVVTTAEDLLAVQELHLAQEGMDSFATCTHCGRAPVQPTLVPQCAQALLVRWAGVPKPGD
mmetsp:Transcript_17317/g.47682  ORF Transcript_17317/g.47682 Transcript_17317/m.47682 type:complete len:474 (-) Transcript_17317:1074-2495(-)